MLYDGLKINKNVLLLFVIMSLSSIAQIGTVTSVTNNQNFFLYYSLNEIQNGKIIDNPGNERDTKVVGNPSIIQGVINNSIDFTSQGEYLDTGIKFLPTRSLSISLWFKHADQRTVSALLLGNNDYGQMEKEEG